jgi:CheY-like chemotaxis protein
VTDRTATVDIVGFYGPHVGPEALTLLGRACAEVDDFRALAQRTSSAWFMVEAIKSVPIVPTKLEQWTVKVTAHFLSELVDQQFIGMLETIAHEDFLLGECPRWNSDAVSEYCPLRDGTDASVWMIDHHGSVAFHKNILVRDYFLARYIITEGTSQLLRFEYPRRWVLTFLAILAPELVTIFASNSSDRIREAIELEVEQKVQATLSHLLKRSAGAVRSHLKSIRRKLAPAQFANVSAEFDRIAQEVEFQIALSEKTRIWSAQPELRIEDITLLPEIESVVGQRADAFSSVDVTIDAPANLVSRCDRQLFHDAFYCLAENAFHAASDASGQEQHVNIRAQRSKDFLTIRVEILDSGPGIHPDDHDRVFQPRVTTKKGGNGHGYSGCTNVLLLRVARKSGERTMNFPAPNSVLVVEDHDSSAADYVRWLTESGHQVTRASARDDALREAQRTRPDVVVLDLKLPSAPSRADEDVRHGLELLDRLIRDDPFRAVVIVTAHSNDREIMREVLQRTNGGQFVFKDAENLESDLRAAIAVALAHPAYSMSRAIRRFCAMLDEDLPEDDYRKFIHQHWYVLLGPEYEDCRSPYEVARGAKVDLFAVRHDGFPDLWELKRPRDPLFSHYNDWLYHSPETSKGMGQLVDYCDMVRHERQLARGYEARKGLSTVVMNRPRGFLIIGRYTGTAEQREAQRDRVRLENSYYAGLTLLTYDDLAERANQYLRLIHRYRPARVDLAE